MKILLEFHLNCFYKKPILHKVKCMKYKHQKTFSKNSEHNFSQCRTLTIQYRKEQKVYTIATEPWKTLRFVICQYTYELLKKFSCIQRCYQSLTYTVIEQMLHNSIYSYAMISLIQDNTCMLISNKTSSVVCPFTAML